MTKGNDMLNDITADDIIEAFGGVRIDGPKSDANRVADISYLMQQALHSEEGQRLAERRRVNEIDREEYRAGMKDIMRRMKSKEQS